MRIVPQKYTASVEVRVQRFGKSVPEMLLKHLLGKPHFRAK